MKNQRTTAFVLRRTNYGEADRIVQLLTPLGKVGAIAKGARKAKSRLAGGIELFAKSDIVITKGRGDLGIITSARIITFYKSILTDYDRLDFGYRVLRYSGRASELVDEPEWYDLVEEIMSGLNQPALSLDLIAIRFYLMYAQLLGDGLSLWRDIHGEPISQAQRYSYDSVEKGLRPSQSGEVTANHIKLLRLLSAKPLQTVVKVGGVEPLLSSCHDVARAHAALPTL